MGPLLKIWVCLREASANMKDLDNLDSLSTPDSAQK